MTTNQTAENPATLLKLKEQISNLTVHKSSLTLLLNEQKHSRAQLTLQKDQLSAKRDSLNAAISKRKEVLNNYDQLIHKAKMALDKSTKIANHLAETLQNVEKSHSKISI